MTFEEYAYWETFLPALGKKADIALSAFMADTPSMTGLWQKDMDEYHPNICASLALSAKLFLINYQKGD